MSIVPDITSAITTLDEAHAVLVTARALLGGGDREPEELPHDALHALLMTDEEYLQAKTEAHATSKAIREMVYPNSWALILKLEQAQNLRSARIAGLAWRLGQCSR